jgi:hypothetical protein
MVGTPPLLPPEEEQPQVPATAGKLSAQLKYASLRMTVNVWSQSMRNPGAMRRDASMRPYGTQRSVDVLSRGASAMTDFTPGYFHFFPTGRPRAL